AWRSDRVRRQNGAMPRSRMLVRSIPTGQGMGNRSPDACREHAESRRMPPRRKQMVWTRQAANTLGAAGYEARPPLPPPPNWWLRLTSSGWKMADGSLEDREFARRSQLLAWIILGMLLVELAVLPASLSDATTLLALGVAAVGTIGAALLN